MQRRSLSLAAADQQLRIFANVFKMLVLA